jgi:flavin reductase (DIM6/NTAB) family NADH-FMN oxidoreductase RutF
MKNAVRHEKMIMPPSTLLNPVPVVMVSCAGLHPERAEDRPNIITIAWAGTICSDPPMVSISIRKSRHSHRLISDTREFVINLVGVNLLRACDYCGVRSGANEDKFASVKLTPMQAEGMKHAVSIMESPASLSCEVVSITELGSHDLFTARIVSISADKYLLDKEGKLCLEKADLVCYSHGDYFSLGRILGFYGYSVASPEAYKRRMVEKGTLPHKKAPIRATNKSPQPPNRKPKPKA